MVKRKNTMVLRKMKSNPDALLEAHRKYTNSMKHVTFATPIHTVMSSPTLSAKQSCKKHRQQRLKDMRSKEMMSLRRRAHQKEAIEQYEREREILDEKQKLEEEAKTIQDKQDYSYLDLCVTEAQMERRKLEEEDQKKRELEEKEDTESCEWSEASSSSSSCTTCIQSKVDERPPLEEIDFGTTPAEYNNSEDDFEMEQRDKGADYNRIRGYVDEKILESKAVEEIDNCYNSQEEYGGDDKGDNDGDDDGDENGSGMETGSEERNLTKAHKPHIEDIYSQNANGFRRRARDANNNIDYNSDWNYTRLEAIKDKMMTLKIGAYLIQETWDYGDNFAVDIGNGYYM